MIDRLIRVTTALTVMAVAVIAAVISYRHAYEIVATHGESGPTARLAPLTVDGLIWAASMVILDANRRHQLVPTLAKWSLGVGIVATIGANLAPGIGHGPIGALVSAWPAVALVGAYELLTALVRAEPAPPPPLRPRTQLRAMMCDLPNRTRHLERRTCQRWSKWYGHGMKRATAKEPSPETSKSTAAK
ncbi:MAG: DUF2637 domain-containing protein [Actinoallomurus sp.]